MIMAMRIEVVFTAESTATGDGRDGHVKSSDGRIDLTTRPPKEAGGRGHGHHRAQVGLGKGPAGGFGINAQLIGYLPGLDQSVADDLMNKAHQVCPYSKATRGNIDVALSA